ncbi:hypothetical protein VP01_1204g5 [Puccinia sorghi]|uniref:Uncharacterized protein n=1 Tax=Puccinia sorghi TaxID=27349 RepID=A0A0L6VQF6_9BASI|nr:hypothetical protein VP01_1204g5 [Puccinia sorghi]
MENEMTQFYVIQLQDTNIKIQTLRDENTHLHGEISRLGMCDITQSHQLQYKVTNQPKIQIQGLKGKYAMVHHKLCQ